MTGIEFYTNGHIISEADSMRQKLGTEPPRLYRRLIYLSQAAMPDKFKLS